MPEPGFHCSLASVFQKVLAGAGWILMNSFKSTVWYHTENVKSLVWPLQTALGSEIGMGEQITLVLKVPNERAELKA